MRPLICLLLLAATPAHSEPMRFETALAMARAAAPSLTAGTAALAARRSAVIAAGQLPDPAIDLAIDNLPITGPEALRLQRDDMTMLRLGLTQRFVHPAKRQARAARAEADVGIAGVELAVARRRVEVETALAWIDLHFADRRLERLRSVASTLEALKRAAPARLAAGSARPSDAIEPRQQLAMLDDRIAAAVADAERARATLVRYTGNADPEIVGPPPVMLVNADAMRARLDAVPTLRRFDAEVAVAAADVELARADKRPDWTVSAGYGRREPAFSDMLSVGVSIDLPLFTGKRQDPLIAARAQELEQSRALREAALREVHAALEQDLAGHRLALARLITARTRLVPLARQRADLDRQSYAAGRIDLGTTQAALVALAEAELDELEREAAATRSAVLIGLVYAGDAT